MERRYAFCWELLGNLREGRPTLGRYARLEAYRLLQFTLRDELEQALGSAETDALFYRAGRTAGGHFYRHVIGEAHDGHWLLHRLQQVLRELGLGVLHLEEAAADYSRFVFALEENLDCSGCPARGRVGCFFDAGVFAGVLEAFFGQPYAVTEVSCWSRGDRLCRFEAVRGEGLPGRLCAEDRTLVHG